MKRPGRWPSLALAVSAAFVLACTSSTTPSGSAPPDASLHGYDGAAEDSAGASDAAPCNGGEAADGGDAAPCTATPVGVPLGGTLGFTVQTGIGDTIPVAGTSEYEAVVLLDDLAGDDACGVLGMGGAYASSKNLFIAVIEGAPIVTGQAYAIAPGPAAGGQAEYYASDASCKNVSSETANSGSVTFTSLGSSTMTGMFSVSFPSGDTLSGNFSVPVCASLGQSPGNGMAGCITP